MNVKYDCATGEEDITINHSSVPSEANDSVQDNIFVMTIIIENKEKGKLIY